MSMNEKRQLIPGLLSGFLSGSLTPQEKGELYLYMIDDVYKDEIIAWLQEQWEIGEQWEAGEAEGIGEIGEAGEKGEIGESAKLKKLVKQRNFEELRELLKLGESVNLGNPEQSGKLVKPGVMLKWKMLLRYAAVVLITFGLSWVVFKRTERLTVVPVANQLTSLYTEFVVPYGSKGKVILPDSSTVWLNSGARLKYPTHFDNLLRAVYLQGEGFFDVVKDAQHPFVVNGSGIIIKVTGTKFNLMANADEQIIETTLVEGEIEISGIKTEGGDQGSLLMKPGQKLTLRKENEQYEVQNIQEAGLIISGETTVPARIKSADLFEKANVEYTTAWTENKLVFVRDRFGDVKTRLERWYGVTIDVTDPEILEYRFNGTFEKQTFEQAMTALSKAASCKFIIDKNHVIISK